MLRIKSPARTLCAALLAAGISVGACSGDDEVTPSGNGKKDSGIAGGAGGVLGTGGGSFGASGDSGSAGVGGNGGDGISGNGGASGNGFGGNGFGGSGASPPDASVGGTAGAGSTCNPQFCPNNGMGTPCCVTTQGPCGMNFGSGCVGDPGGNPG